VARWCDHSAYFAPQFTAEWSAWTTHNARHMRQTDFARFMEDNQGDVADGVGGQLYHIALAMEIKKSVEFQSANRMENGSTQFVYNEDVQGTAQAGAFTVPSQFSVVLKPFIGGASYRIDCRLRYRLQERQLVIWYEMVRPDKVVETALAKMRSVIEEQTKIRAYAGTVS
jgi:uncharacterized protein YfdQ (DUF2303 family)